jgi:hypothetical protein
MFRAWTVIYLKRLGDLIAFCRSKNSENIKLLVKNRPSTIILISLRPLFQKKMANEATMWDVSALSVSALVNQFIGWNTKK